LLLPSANIPKDEDIYFTMLEVFRSKIGSDKQVETKTGAFLCNSGCEKYYNFDGDIFDCSKVTDIARRLVDVRTRQREIKIAELGSKKESISQSNTTYKLDARDVKEMLDIETMIDIVDSLGISVTSKGKCSIREDERTPSTQLYSGGWVHDFGGDSMDIFTLVMDRVNLDFPSAIKYVNEFIRR
jgi:hypothetical protein